MLISKYPIKDILNFVQLAAPKFVKKFVALFRENWKIQILRIFSENLLIGPISDKKSENFGAASWKNSEDFFEEILIRTHFQKIWGIFRNLKIWSKF